MTWTHRERVLAALHHEEPDRVPIDFGGAEFTSITPPAYENLKRHLGVECETRMMSIIHSVVHPDEQILRRFDIDTRNVIGSRPDNGRDRVVDENCYIDIFDVTWRRTVGTDDIHFLHVDGPFHRGKLTVDAVDAFDWPDPNDPGLVRGVREQVEAIKRNGDHFVLLYLPGGIIHRGYAMRGFENYLKDIYRNREGLLRLMEKLCDYWVGVAHNMMDAAGRGDVDGVFFGEDLGTQDGCMFDPDNVYATYMKPFHRRMVEAVKYKSNAKVVFHCCGSAYHFIDHLIDIGVDALNPVQVTAKDMEPEKLKAAFGDRISFWGGINSQRILPFGTPQEVAAETRRMIEILGRGGGYVVNSVHNIQPEVPPENIVAMFDTARDFRYEDLHAHA